MSKTIKRPSIRRQRGLLFWLSPEVATFIYTILLKPRPLRLLATRLIRLMIPAEIEVSGASVTLNPKDAIVSGNLALGCYERFNMDFLLQHLEEGQHFLDIGANLGLYSLIAASRTGPSGRVLGVEPGPENLSFLETSIQRNGFENLTPVQAAIGDACGTAALFVNDLNLADHRLYNVDGRTKSIPVEVVTVDELLARHDGFVPDWIKIDTQGFEAKVWRGMRGFLDTEPDVNILMEVWPWGIRQAGDDPAELLHSIRDHGFHMFRLDGHRRHVSPIDEATVLGLDAERQHCDLLISRRDW